MSWIMRTDTVSIAPGVYIYYQTQGYITAVYQLADENQTYYEYHMNGYSLLDVTLEDKPVSQHVDTFARNMCEQYIVVNTLFNELGLTVTGEEQKEINKEAKSIYRNSQAYMDGIGVTEADIADAVASTLKEQKVFDEYYKIGGIMGTTEETVNAYVNEKYARIKIIEFNFADSVDDAIDAERKNTMLALANVYLDRANNGEDFDALIAEITGEDTPDEEYANEFIIDTTSTVPSHKFTKYVFSNCKVGTYTIIQDDVSFYLVQRLNLLEREDIKRDSQALIIAELFDSNYTALINTKLREYTVETNADAVKKCTAYNAVMGKGSK